MTNIDFVGKRNIGFAISLVIITIGLAAIIFKGLAFGIEFKGGTLFEVRFTKAVEISEVRAAVKPLGLGESVIQQGGDSKAIFIRTQELDSPEQVEVRDALKKLGAKDFNIQKVGASWGKRLTEGTVVALLVSLIIVLGFIAVRFEFKMGIAAVVALTHDVLIAIGIYALLGRQVTTSTVAAFLTILGYSIYDTIVIFDRVRENAARIKKVTYSTMVNESVNQSLRRSINTSLTSIIPVLALIVVGGETLKDFAFALFIGLASGTYSSIFIASPFLAWWKETEPRYVAMRKKLAKS